MLELQDLYKKFGTQEVLRGFSLGLKPGETVVLLGANGAGKSTVLDMAAGITEPDAGQLKLEGLTRAQNPEAWKTKLTLVAERVGLFPHLTLEEQLLFTGRLYGIPEEESRRRTGELLKFFGLEEASRKTSLECSLGMQNKLSLALGLLPGPRYLLIDEALNGLDPVSVVRSRQLFRELGARGVGILVCSHVLDHLENIGDRVIILKDGKVHSETLRSQVSGENGLEELYLHAYGQPPEGGCPWAWF